MKYLVLGSSGQIGRHLVKILISEGHTVVEYDIARSKFEDLRFSSDRLIRLVDDSEFVFFLAFDVGGSRYLKKFQNTFGFLSNNVKIMDTVFGLLKAFSKPFIFASSQMASMNYSSYGTLKAIGEFYTTSLGGLSVRLWNVYGVEHDFGKSHVITDFIVGAQSGEIKMMTDGSEMRQFLHADDCSAALLVLAQKYREVRRSSPVDLSSFEWVTVADVAKLVSQLCGNVPVIFGNESDTIQRDARVDPNNYILEYWLPKISLSAGISEIIKATNKP